MNHKILANHKKVRQGELPTISTRVIEHMENNPVFPNPPAALAKLKEVIPEYQISLALAMGRDREMVALKDNKKEIIVNLLDELASYVTAICKGDRNMLLSSGFKIAAEGGSSMPPAIEKLEVILSEAGEATTRIKNAKGAIAFVHEYTTEPPGPDTNWVSRGSSLRTCTFTGLTSEKRHWFRAVAIGYGGLIAYSPIVTRVIQ